MKYPLQMKRLLPWSFMATATSGFALHIAGHAHNFNGLHSWAMVHILTSLLWLITVIYHIIRHIRWYKVIASKGIGKKSLTTITLTALFLTTASIGIWMIACVDGENSPEGLWHYRSGIVLTILTTIHGITRKVKGRFVASDKHN